METAVATNSPAYLCLLFRGPLAAVGMSKQEPKIPAMQFFGANVGHAVWIREHPQLPHKLLGSLLGLVRLEGSSLVVSDTRAMDEKVRADNESARCGAVLQAASNLGILKLGLSEIVRATNGKGPPSSLRQALAGAELQLTRALDLKAAAVVLPEPWRAVSSRRFEVEILDAQ